MNGKSKSIFLANVHYAYAQTDGTYAWPNSLEGDLLKQAMKELLVLRQERDEARWEVCGFHHLTGFLAGDYAISRGWDYFNDERKWAKFPPSVKEFDEFLKAQSQLNIEAIDRLREENRTLREENRKLRELRVQGIVSEPHKATPPKYENLED